MKTTSATEVARNVRAVLDALEREQEEIVVVRNRRTIARLVPEAPQRDAMARSRVGAEAAVGWLIDTSLWIAVERGSLGAADIHAVTRPDSVYLSPINVADALRTGDDEVALSEAEGGRHTSPP